MGEGGGYGHLCLQDLTELQASTVRASIVAGDAGKVCYAPQVALGNQLRIFYRGLLHVEFA